MHVQKCKQILFFTAKQSNFPNRFWCSVYRFDFFFLCFSKDIHEIIHSFTFTNLIESSRRMVTNVIQAKKKEEKRAEKNKTSNS